jgi:dGTPase
METVRLHPAACDPERGLGRRHVQVVDAERNEYQRDRDRIVHSTAFRRLVYKTQVFLNHEGDLFRTRLTHSLEVAQVARSIGRSLSLHEDLIEAIALAHDLGHTPFGHAGQDALDECLRSAEPDGGGFEHNFQSLRVVDALDDSYPAHPGLNLTFEAREGILKHCSRANALRLQASGDQLLAARFLEGGQPGLEAQLCNLADEVAYNAHDIDDGVRSGLLSLEQVEQAPLFGRYLDQAMAEHGKVATRVLIRDAVRRMLSEQIRDVLAESASRISLAAPARVDDVRRSPGLIGFSADMQSRSVELKRFLRTNLYRHPRVTAQTDAAKRVIRDLFHAYLADESTLPAADRERPHGRTRARTVADYIAGMTDRFARGEHERLTGQKIFPASPDDR